MSAMTIYVRITSSNHAVNIHTNSQPLNVLLCWLHNRRYDKYICHWIPLVHRMTSATKTVSLKKKNIFPHRTIRSHTVQHSYIIFSYNNAPGNAICHHRLIYFFGQRDDANQIKWAWLAFKKCRNGIAAQRVIIIGAQLRWCCWGWEDPNQQPKQKNNLIITGWIDGRRRRGLFTL